MEETIAAVEEMPAEKYLGSGARSPVIFDANKPMLTHPDKICPGQVLRIPKQGQRAARSAAARRSRQRSAV